MIDFGALPPEVNSGRMYAGAGVAPMLAAAVAWDGLGSQLGLTAASYESTLAGLTGGPWIGPASISMLAAAAPYVAWLSATADQAEQAATQAKAAAAAYEAAFAMTVPPPVIAANRALLMTLIATNFFGQNTPAIAATEAHYAEMWAQDATAMYGYAGSSADASKVTPFTSPPHTTNPAGLTGQATAVGHATSTAPGTPATPPHVTSTVPHTLQALAQPTSPPPVSPKPPASVPPVPPGVVDFNHATSFFLSYTNGSAAHTVNFGMRALFNGHEFPKAVEAMNAVTKTAGGAAKAIGSAPAAVPGLGGGGLPVATGLGQAARIGGMSVPASFPGVGPTAVPAAARALGAAVVTQEGMGGMPGIPGAPAASLAGAAGGGHGFRFVPRYGYRHKVMARPPSAG